MIGSSYGSTNSSGMNLNTRSVAQRVKGRMPGIKNRQERFLTSASFADGLQGEGRKARVILPGAPYNKKAPPVFWWGFFIVRCCGVTYMLKPSEKMVIRAEYALGKSDNSAFYLKFGQPF